MPESATVAYAVEMRNENVPLRLPRQPIPHPAVGEDQRRPGAVSDVMQFNAAFEGCCSENKFSDADHGMLYFHSMLRLDERVRADQQDSKACHRQTITYVLSR